MKKIFPIILLLLTSMPVLAQTASVERLGEHVYTLAADSMLGRSAGTDNSRRAAEYIIKNFSEIGLRPFVGDTSYKQKFSFRNNSTRTYTNIIGYIPGSDPALRDEYVIIGAHYDHLGYKVRGRDTVVYSGADDNASGTAALIEAARILKGREGMLRRSVVFAAFDAEEIGLHGSAHMASLLAPEKVKAMISIDMVGWLREGKRLRLAGVGTLDNGKAVIGSVPVPEGLPVKLKKFDRNVMTGSDHDSFAAKGIPSFYATTGIKSPYHEPEDTAEKIDYEGLSLVSEYMASMGETLANSDRLEASGRVSGKHRENKFEFAVTGSVGSSLHRYPEGALTGKPAFAWNAGAFVQYNINPWFSLRLEGLYQDRTARFPTEDTQLGAGYREFNTQAVTVPLNLMFKLPAANNFYMYFSVGGYYAYNLKGSLGGVALDFDTGARRHEYGWTASFGFNLSNYGLAFTSYNAFSPVMRTGPVMKNSASFFTLYYRF